MNPLVIIALAALGVVGVGGFASLPSDAELAPATAISDPYAELPIQTPYETRPEAPETTQMPGGVSARPSTTRRF
jgi:hypothetical protein